MSAEKITISILIVNYNVREFLEQSLLSVKRALAGIPSEIIVVDNASIDGSVQMLRERFPEVKLIESNKNLGFSAGNNLGLRIAAGRYIVLLNPDTVVQEDTFANLLAFFKNTPDASAATCKILNPDGSFSIDCRHSIPTPLTAFWKLIGFAKLFPKSRIFAKYNLTYLDENETYPVEAISGSFMMLKKEVVGQIGLLDETFFMYCEDIDYCHRINQAHGKIYYVPDSQIIHYKGESTKKNNLDYIITFNRSLYQFYKKHYQQKYFYPFKWLILLGTIFRGSLVFLQNNFKLYYPLLIDLFFLNLIMTGSFYMRYELKGGFTLNDFFSQYIIINVITSAAFFINALFFETASKMAFSISKIIKAIFITFLFVAALTFFFKMFAFSRMVVLISAIGTSVALILWRFIFRLFGKKSGSALSRDYFLRRTLIVGFDEETKSLMNKLESLVATGIEFIGAVSLTADDIGKKFGKLTVVTSVNQLPEYIRMQKIDLVIFTTHNLSYRTILTAMSRVQNARVDFKMVPGHLEFMIGKSTIERLDALPLVDIEYAYGKLFNRFNKRFFDMVFALLQIIILSPVGLIAILLNIRHLNNVEIHLNEAEPIRMRWITKSGFARYFWALFGIVRGKISFVGSPLAFKSDDVSSFDYKPGLTGLVQLNGERIVNLQNRENFELHYLKNQNFFLDAELMIRALFKKSYK